ncbi:C1 family peptidase [Rhizobium leguminosarum]|uniref:C1 family peptidase n=1 Tax=Rhizobium leguminosarum TaxID=384 RepID=UPI0014421886
MIAATLDLRHQLLPTRQQGSRQTCLAFAASSAHELIGKHTQSLSVEYLFFHAVERTAGSNPHNGTSMEAMASALADVGQPIEMAWPYLPRQLVAPDWVPPSVNSEIYRRPMTVGRMSSSDISSTLDSGRAVVLGLIISDAFWQVDAVGVVPDVVPDIDRGGHAVLAVGHGLDHAGKRYFLVRNSWGSEWGVGGYAWLSESYLARQLHETATLN